MNQLRFNRPQMNFVMNLHRIHEATNVWGRGTGKSFIIAWLMHYIIKSMPRSNWAIQGATFQQLLTRTLPGTLAAMEKLGYKRDVDYFINRFPPKSYDLPFETPLKPDNCLFFVNHEKRYSVAFSLFSQDRSSGRGPNRDGIICDESLLLDYEKFAAETLATNRGNDVYFRDVKAHHGVFHFTSMPMGNSWLFDAGSYYKTDFQILRNKICDLQLEFIRTSDVKLRKEIYREIYNASQELHFKPSSAGQYYSEWSSFDNIENLGIRYLESQYRNMPELLFSIEILNKRISKIEDSFYPNLNRNVHCYKGHFDYNHLDNFEFNFESLANQDSRQDLDCNPDEGLDIGLDFGVHINWLIVGQEVKAKNQFNFLKNFYVKSPQTIDDCARLFCDYYEHHRKKIIYLYPDAEGNVRQKNLPGQMTYVDQVKKIFRDKGWQVVVRNTAKYNVRHKEKYITWSRCLSEQSDTFPRIRFNLINCKELIYSMEQTPAIDYGGNDIRKNKESEKMMKANREQATDAGDAADQIVFGKYGHLNKLGSGFTIGLASEIR